MKGRQVKPLSNVFDAGTPDTHRPTHARTNPSTPSTHSPTCKLPEGSARSTNPCAYFISRRFVGNSVRSWSVFNRVMATSQFLMRCDSSSTGGSASASLLLLVGAIYISINIIYIYMLRTCLYAYELVGYIAHKRYEARMQQETKDGLSAITGAILTKTTVGT